MLNYMASEYQARGGVNSAFEKLFGDLVKRGFNKIDYLKFA